VLKVSVRTADAIVRTEQDCNSHTRPWFRLIRFSSWRSARIVLPKRLREELGITARTRLMLTRRGDKLVAIRLDVEELARKLESELEGVEVEELAVSVRKEINEKIARERPELSAG
jgi:bifunctional DNA-binding transcriptional regulator/antitoxin component of YhaV-PrlF toxin-antitoxin module